MTRTKLYLVATAVLSLLAFAAFTPTARRLGVDRWVEGAAPSTQVVQGITTTSSAVFVPLGYNRLSCTGDVYYKVVSASTGTAATTDSLARGPLSVNSITVARPVWINITSNQWLALLNRSGVNTSCSIEQVSVDGLAGTFTDLTATGNLAVTGTESVTGAATHGAVINAAGFDGGYIIGTTINTSGATVLGSTLSATGVTVSGTLTNSGDNITASTKTRGTATLNGASPSVATATVNTGAICVCTNTGTAANPVKCAVSSTTLTITGPNAASDVVAYHCMQ